MSTVESVVTLVARDRRQVASDLVALVSLLYLPLLLGLLAFDRQ